MSLHPEEVQALLQHNTTNRLTRATHQVLSSLEIFELASEEADSAEVSESLTQIEAALGELVMKYNVGIVESN